MNYLVSKRIPNAEAFLVHCERLSMKSRSVVFRQGEPSEDLYLIAMNAGAGLYVGGQADSLEAGIALAMDAMHSGNALQTLEAFAELTQAAGGA